MEIRSDRRPRHALLVDIVIGAGALFANKLGLSLNRIDPTMPEPSATWPWISIISSSRALQQAKGGGTCHAASTCSWPCKHVMTQCFRGSPTLRLRPTPSGDGNYRMPSDVGNVARYGEGKRATSGAELSLFYAKCFPSAPLASWAPRDELGSGKAMI